MELSRCAEHASHKCGSRPIRDVIYVDHNKLPQYISQHVIHKVLEHRGGVWHDIFSYWSVVVLNNLHLSTL